MLYTYYCPKCKTTEEINKPVSEAGRKERCECGKEMQRVYNAPSIKTMDNYKQ